MLSPRSPKAAAGARLLPAGILRTVRGVMKGHQAASSASHHAAGNSHGGSQRQRLRQIALLMFGALALTLVSIQLVSRVMPRRATPEMELQPADPPAPALPDWLAEIATGGPDGSGGSGGGGGTEGNGADAGGAAFAASVQLNPELEGVRGNPAEQAAALKRMRRWEHGLDGLQVRIESHMQDSSG